MPVVTPSWRAAPLPWKLATTRTAGDSCGRQWSWPGNAAFTFAALRCANGITSILPPLAPSDWAGLPPRRKLLGCGTGAPQWLAKRSNSASENDSRSCPGRHTMRNWLNASSSRAACSGPSRGRKSMPIKRRPAPLAASGPSLRACGPNNRRSSRSNCSCSMRRDTVLNESSSVRDGRPDARRGQVRALSLLLYPGRNSPSAYSPRAIRSRDSMPP